jgi:MtN3 and saliva related transmembrane protein
LENNTQLIGISAAVLTAVSMLPQLYKIIKEKKAENVSILMIVVLMSGLSLWIWYGVQKKDYPIIFTNIFSLLVNMFIMFFGIKYKKKDTS